MTEPQTAVSRAPTAGRRPAMSPVVIGVGVAAGFLAGLFGVGGGLLIVPGLVLAMGMNQRLAHGTSLAAVVPISIASLITYSAHDNVDWPASLWLALGAVGGAVVGTKLLHVLPHRTLGLLFSGVLLVSAIRLFINVEADGRGDITIGTVVSLVLVGITAGVLAGLLGVGGGVIMVPAMILLFGIPPAIAKGTSAAVIIPTALMGTWRNRKNGNSDLHAALVIGVAGVVTAALGGIVADKMSDSVSNVLFATLLVIVAVRLLWQLRHGEEAEPDVSPAPE